MRLQAARWRQYAASTPSSPVVRFNLREKLPVLLGEAFKWYPRYMLEKRAKAAAEKGVKTEIAVMDGNMKLAGRICARAHAEVEHSEGLQMWLAHCCSQQPAFKKRRCTLHTESERPVDPFPPQAEVVVGHRRSRRVCDGEAYDVLLQPRGMPTTQGRWVPSSEATPTQLHEYWRRMEDEGSSVPVQSSVADLQASSCKTHKELGELGVWQKKLIRAGRANGWLFAVTPDGYALHAKPYYGSESLSQRHFFLAELVGAYPNLSSVIHDDACHVRRYCYKHRNRSALATRLAYPNVRYILDRWHQAGHTDDWCRTLCRADTEENQAVLSGVNTSRAEAWNSLVSRHRWVLRSMTHLTRSFFMHEVVDLRNAVMLEEKCAQRPCRPLGPVYGPAGPQARILQKLQETLLAGAQEEIAKIIAEAQVHTQVQERRRSAQHEEAHWRRERERARRVLDGEDGAEVVRPFGGRASKTRGEYPEDPWDENLLAKTVYALTDEDWKVNIKFS
eukprot:s3136_g3.t1